MPKSSRKSRSKRSVYNQNRAGNPENIIRASSSSVLKPVSISPAKEQMAGYNAEVYVKNDIKWSLITGLIIAVILVILYFVLR